MSIQDDQERSAQWSRLLKSMRLLGGGAAILLFLALLGPVILNLAPPRLLVLALGPAMLWLTTWIWEGRPPKGWSARDPALAEQADQRLRKVGGRLMALGLVFAIGSMVFAVLQISTHH
jgi:uncharacterized protein YjeT (DUF2065 family)